MPPKTSDPDAFIKYWLKAEASERANAQPFLIALAELLDVPPPTNSHATGYSFEYPVRIPTGPTTHSDGRIDLYRRGCFVLEAKQFAAQQPEQTDLTLVGVSVSAIKGKKPSGPVRGSGAWDYAMILARSQAERYARALPADEPTPPFLLVVDVGHSIEVYADFTQAGKSYLPFPEPRTFRLKLDDLRDEKIRERLRRIWTEPLSLDPSKVSAAVTREIAGYLAILATSLEKAGHTPRLVAEFLTRCLFCMFAEDVGLLPADGFRNLLESLRQSPEGFVPKLRTLFAEMQSGTDFSVVLNKKLLRFNGGLFEDASVLPVDGTQLGILINAASKQWKNVEPAIFGTLLERALDPRERHQLGAHYTPRAYVERLVLPTVVEPLRAEWEAVKTAALVHAQKSELAKARAAITRFHDHLCDVKILDPACGSGNFLYVALEHLKRLEGEVLDAAADFGEDLPLDLSTHSVDPHQFLGIELNPRAASVAELVLWIGYLQWHFRTRGQTLPEEPVLKKFKNIECRDALLAWDGKPQPARDQAGEIITVWDRHSMKTDLLTNRDVPDETKRVPLLTYPNARPAKWPKADYIVGNPPFLGAGKDMRLALGDNYTEALWTAYSKVPESADFVMFWWNKAADLVQTGSIRQFGFITTKTIWQVFNRRVLSRHLEGGLSVTFAIPNHPWVDSLDGAAVRIAMTTSASGKLLGRLSVVIDEKTEPDGSASVTLETTQGPIQPNLRLGANIGSMEPLIANTGLSFMGAKLHGDGFVVSRAKAKELGLDHVAGLDQFVREYRNGKDLMDHPRHIFVIDFYGLNINEVRHRFPEAYQHLLTTVKPERDQNKRSMYRENWWIFAEPRPAMRHALNGLDRYIVTAETAKHRVFSFLSKDIFPDQKLRIVGSDDSFLLGVLSSHTHVVYALAAGGRLGVGDDPVYNTTLCFDPFPFPACDEAAKTRIRSLGEELDAHRKRVQTQHPSLSFTAMYNILEALRAGRALTVKEQTIHDNGLVSILRQLHDELDAAVTAAYGWPANLSDAEILTRLVALNADRAAEEATGLIRWLRPAYQDPTGATTQTGLGLVTSTVPLAKSKAPKAKEPWPKTLTERVQAVERALQGAAAPATASTLAKRFSRVKLEEFTEILDTLTMLGRARREAGTYGV